MYLLDTDTCIYLLNKRNPSVLARLKELDRQDVATSTITTAELLFGAAHSEKRETNTKRVHVFCSALTLCPFDQKAAEIFGPLKEELVSRGMIIGAMDLLIASVALSQKAVLVTHNLKEFQRIPGLRSEDWFAAP